MSDSSKTLEDSRKFAKENNLNLILPLPNQLFIDIDSQEQYEQFLTAVEIFRKRKMQKFGYTSYPSRSNSIGKKHIILQFESWSLTETQRIMLQSIFGSDFKREILNWIDFWNGEEFPTIFFEKFGDNITFPEGVVDGEHVNIESMIKTKTDFEFERMTYGEE